MESWWDCTDNFLNQNLMQRTRNIYIFYFIILTALFGYLIGVRLIVTFVLGSDLKLYQQIIPGSLLYVAFLIFTFFYRGHTNLTWYEMGYHREYLPQSLFIGFLATSGFLIAVGIFRLPLNYPSAIFIFILFQFTWVVGITEETLFRGYIQAKFQKEMSQMKAVFMTGILFAFLHIPSYLISGNFANLLGLSSLILIGLILGFIRIHTGNIWGVAMAHATWDFYQFLFVPNDLLSADLTTLIAALAASGGMWGSLILSMILAKNWIKRPTQMPRELIHEYSIKIENLTEQIWKLQGLLSTLQLGGFPFGRRVEHYRIVSRTSEEIIQVLKGFIPNINEQSYLHIRKLVPLYIKGIKLKNLLNFGGSPARLMILQSKLALIEAQIAAIEREFGATKPISNLANSRGDKEQS